MAQLACLVPLLTREAFERQRAAVKRVERHEGLVLAIVSVGLGVLQLGFLRWAEMHLARSPRVTIAGSVFLAYLAVVGALLWRMERRVRVVRPACPQCGRALKDMSQRVAAATGRCDRCGGWILTDGQ